MRVQRMWIIYAGREVTIIVKLPSDDEFKFRFDARSEWAARLLVAAIREAIEASVCLDREEYYRIGRRSARDKRYKISRFHGSLP